eukprot:jgi/Ulvmu1/11163/UM071_0047.1
MSVDDTLRQQHDSMQKKLATTSEQIEKNYLRPLQKEAFHCCARCCDSSGTHQDFQRCAESCQSQVMQAEATFKQAMEGFSNRLHSCMQRCQHLAQDSLGTSGSESESTIAAVQGQMNKCLSSCLSEYEGKIPKMMDNVMAQLKQSQGR